MCSAQIVVVFMSLGFIGFVTVLHIIGKVSPARLLRDCCSASAGTWVRAPFPQVKNVHRCLHHDSLHLVAKICCSNADARIGVRMRAILQTCGSGLQHPCRSRQALLLCWGSCSQSWAGSCNTVGAVLPTLRRLLQLLLVTPPRQSNTESMLVGIRSSRSHWTHAGLTQECVLTRKHVPLRHF